MPSKRTARNSHFSNQSLLVPFDCLDFGDPEKDPCFGKHYDLMDDTCLTCGDIEWCATIFNQKLVSRRIAEEKDGNNYDLEIDQLELNRDIKNHYNELLKKVKPLKALFRTSQRFQVTRVRVKQVINGH